MTTAPPTAASRSASLAAASAPGAAWLLLAAGAAVALGGGRGGSPSELAGVQSLLGLAAADLRRAGIYVICLILAITVHEFAHAYAAHRLGDPTPEREGRLTLSPMSHADPIGTVLLPVVLALSSAGVAFGWGRPVPTQPHRYTRRVSMAAGLAIVAVAGPLSNLLLAAASYGVIAGLSVAGVLDAAMLLHGAALPLYVFFSLNLALFMFNLLPLHPLDGGKVLAWLLEWLAPRQARGVDDFLAQYGGIILIILIVALPQVLALYFWPVTWAAAHLLAAVL